MNDRIKYTFAFFFTFLGIPFFLNAQQITLLDKSDLQPISQVTVSNQGKTHQVITNHAGQADISGFKAGDTLFFNHVAFQPLHFAKQFVPSDGKIYLTENVIKLDEFVLSGNRVEEKKSDLPYKMEIIQSKDIQFKNPANAAIMLEQSGNVFVQTSQLGGGSPVLRGFEANRVLLVVDGVRMNNAIYRAGHLQNSITVDPFGLGSAEILYGPGSTLYGSDALGGVVNFKTADPVPAITEDFEAHGNILARTSLAITEGGLTGHRNTTSYTEGTIGANISLGWKKMAALLNFSFSDFGDLAAGSVRNPAYGDFGQRNFFAERINGKDSTLKNDKPWLQKQSAYSQYNLMGKLLYQPDSYSRYLLNVQYSNSGDVPRYDRLTEMKNDSTMKYSEWYYGPQARSLVSLRAEYSKSNKIYDHASVVAAFQQVQEDRIQRDFGSAKKKYNLETVKVYSINADLEKNLTKQDKLNYGVEFTLNDVTSGAHNTNITTDETTYDRATRYPDDKAGMMSVAGYLSNRWKINELLNFSQGLRFSYITLNAAYSDTMVKIMKIPFNPEISQKNSALSGYLGLTAAPGDDWKFSLVGSTGFRAPNIDDLTKLNVVTGSTIVMPNPDLKPEYSYNLELTIAKTINGNLRMEATGFYNWLRDAQVIRPLAYNGQDSIVMDGDKYQALAPVNAGNAYVCGLQGSLLAQVTRSFSILSNLTYTYGLDQTEDVPLDHIPPVYGMTSFRMEVQKFKGDFYVMYNGWKRISQFSPGGEDNEQYATPYGMPAWYTLNLKLSYQPVKQLNVEIGMENILDEHYRKFASGISAPGRNLIVALRGNF